LQSKNPTRGERGITVGAQTTNTTNHKKPDDIYVSQQTKDAKAGNHWAEFKLWDAYYNGTHEVDENPVKADQWLGKFVKDVYVVRFESANGFNPKNAMDYLNDIRKHTPQVSSEKNGVGTGSFFRTKKEGDKLVASFLTDVPDMRIGCILRASALSLSRNCRLHRSFSHLTCQSDLVH
jgi:hypothetical protein